MIAAKRQSASWNTVESAIVTALTLTMATDVASTAALAAS